MKKTIKIYINIEKRHNLLAKQYTIETLFKLKYGKTQQQISKLRMKEEKAMTT